jgi:hypothetical protein
MWYLKKHLFLDIFSTNINTFVPSLSQCVDIRRRDLFYCCLSNFRTWLSIIYDFLSSLRVCFGPAVNCFKRQRLPTVSSKHFFRKIICIESFCPNRAHKRTPFFGSILLKRLRVCYLVIHIENLLRPLQLFYLHLWLIYWLFLMPTIFGLALHCTTYWFATWRD